MLTMVASPSDSLLSGLYWPDVALSFFSILMEGVPFLLLGAIASGLVDLYLPAEWLRRFLPRSNAKGMLCAIGAAFLFPLCECGAMPVISRLIRKGVPFSVATTYLLATPLFNPLTLLSTWLAFRGQQPWLMLELRVGFGAAVVLLAGFWLARQRAETVLRAEALMGGNLSVDDSLYSASVRPGSPLPRLQQFCGAVIRDFLGVLLYLVIGAAFAAFFSVGVNRAAIDPLGQHPFFGPLAAIALAQALCLCSTTDAFIIATFSSFSVAAKTAFLVAGPLFDLKLLWLYQSLYEGRFVRALWALVTGATLALCFLYALYAPR